MRELKAFRKTFTQITKDNTLPGQRKKIANLVPFSGNAQRILQMFGHIRYRLRPPEEDRSAIYPLTDRTFWGLVLVALLDPHYGSEVIRDLLDGYTDVPNRDERLAILQATVHAVRKHHDPDHPEFRSLADRLNATTA